MKRRQKLLYFGKLAIAASLLLFFSLGYQFIKTDSKVITSSGTKENSVVIQEKKSLNKPRDFQNHKTRCRSYSKKQIENL
jgi:Ca-activated chloride channel family protein